MFGNEDSERIDKIMIETEVIIMTLFIIRTSANEKSKTSRVRDHDDQ